MPKKKKVETVRAPHGQKMIEVKIRFWTNGLAEENAQIPRHAWAAGVVKMERNDFHGIKPGTPKPFNTLGQIPAAIERTLAEHGVVLHMNSKMRKYLA